MAASKKEIYKKNNLEFLAQLKCKDEMKELPCGILYTIEKRGEGVTSPTINSIVTVNYIGKLISGKEFDNSIKRNCPEAFRLRDVIDGWQIALQKMHVGDRWTVYIPYNKGYGDRANGDIPAFSTLVFDIELLGVM